MATPRLPIELLQQAVDAVADMITAKSLAEAAQMAADIVKEKTPA